MANHWHGLAPLHSGLSDAQASRRNCPGPDPYCTSPNTDTGSKENWSIPSDKFSDPTVSVCVVGSEGARDEVMREWSSEYGTSPSCPVRGPARVRAVDRRVPTRATAALLSDLGF